MIHLKKRRKYLVGFLVFIACVSSVLYSLTSLGHGNADDENFTRTSKTAEIHSIVEMKGSANVTCLARIVFARSGGRLGNNLMEYASAWSLAKLNGLTPIVADDVYNAVSPLFSNLSVAPLSRFLSKLYEKDAKCGQIAENVFLRGENRLELSSLKQVKKMKSTGPIIIKSYSVHASSIHLMRNSLKEEFQYIPQLKRYAWQTLRKAASGLNNTVPTSKVVYVGIHVRRTDYSVYIQQKLGLTNLVTEDYYVHAMKYMLKRVNKNNSSKVVFAVTSDDMEWTTKTLIPVLKKELQLMELFRCNAIVSWCGSEDYRKDLALLSACNNSIISYGTYGAWSALMAGGNTVVYKLHSNGKENASAQRFGRMFSNWKIMN